MATNGSDLGQLSPPRAAHCLDTQGREARIDTITTAALLLVYLVVLVPAFGTGNSADLLAIWNAGVAIASGVPGDVYPPTTGPFTMLPPDGWLERLRSSGFTGEVYPFLYPPLWAWVMGKLSLVTSFQTVSQVASALNALLLPATLLLAHSIAAPQMRRWPFLLLGLIILLLPPIGMVALFQNQPQILVSFLTVLALQRAIHGRERAAGAVLAVAAAIKVYPVLLVILWLAAGRFRAAGTFCLVGGILGAASVAVAGWPLHVTFLELLSTISHSVLLTPMSYTLDGGIAQMVMPDRLTLVPAPHDPGVPGYSFGWFVMSEPRAMSILGLLAQVAALAVFARLLMRGPGPRAEGAIWPLAMMVLSLLGPVSWGYHYIAPLAFAPMVLERLRPRADVFLVLAGMILLSAGLFLSADLPWPMMPRQIAGLAGILCFTAAFAVTRPIWRRDTAGPPTS